MKKEKVTPAREFAINIRGNQYSTVITQGKIIDFETNKVLLSKGFYSSIADIQTLNVIDSQAALLSFFSDIKKDAKIDMMDLDPIDTKEILIEMEKFFKWYLSWKEFMNDYEKVEKLEEDENTN